jgi:hypothetical protein
MRPILVAVTITTIKMRTSSSGDVRAAVLAEFSGAPWSLSGVGAGLVLPPGCGETMKKAVRAIPASKMTPARTNTAFAFAFFCCMMAAMIKENPSAGKGRLRGTGCRV